MGATDAARADEAVLAVAAAGLLEGVAGVVGLGVDLVELDRMATVLERTPRFADRVFTPAETEYCRARRDPTERFAARFAAKEATLKAMGLGLWSVPMTSIEVVRDDESGQPSLVLHDAAAAAASAQGIASWRLTITHTDRVAVALALALGPGADPGASSG